MMLVTLLAAVYAILATAAAVVLLRRLWAASRDG